MRIPKFSDKQKATAVLVGALYCIFLAVNWIYGRTQLSGYMPLPFSLLMLTGGTYLVYTLTGELLGTGATLARHLSLAATLLVATVGFSAVVIYSLSYSQDDYQETNLVAEPVAPEPLIVKVRADEYEFAADDSTAPDLDTMIQRYLQLSQGDLARPVIIAADQDISYTRVIETLTALKTAGATRISLSTDRH